MPPKKSLAERKAEREEIRRRRQRRQGVSTPLPQALSRMQRTGRLTQAQENKFRSQEALGPLRRAISAVTADMSAPGLSKSEWMEMDSKYQKMYKLAARLQQVIDNPGDFFWEDGKFKNIPRPPPGGGAGGGVVA